MNIVVLLTLLLSFTLSPMAQADELGRLFFTPQQRKQLEQEQQTLNAAGANTQNTITVNGLIQSSNGNRIVWINGKAQHDNSGKKPNAVTVSLPGKNTNVEIKVGQRLLLDDAPLPNLQRSP
ncbi:MAG: hypothetical protein R8K20_12150 [Gallionellaceae bacterium]